MATRVLRRLLPLGVVPSKSSPTSPYPLPKTRPFCDSSHLFQGLPSKSSSSPRFSQQVPAISSLLQSHGFPQPQMHDFLQQNQFVLESSAADVEECIKILLSFVLSQKSLVSILCSCPAALGLQFLRRWRLVFSELGSFSPSLVQRVLEQSGTSRVEPDDIHTNVVHLKNLGFSDQTVRRALEELPLVFLTDLPEILNKVDILKGFGLKIDEIDQICYDFLGVFSLSSEGKLKPLLEELRNLGIARNELRKVVKGEPGLVLGMEAGELSRCVELLNSLKCRKPIKKRILSKGLLRAAIEVRLRVECLHCHGLIRRDAFKVLFVEPRTILYDLKDVEKKIQFLVHEMKFSVEHLVDFPEYLGVNLDKHLIPRYSVVQHLRSVGALGDEVGMKHMVKLSRHRFYNLYVKPYLGCEKIFGGRMREAEVKSRHPTGIWKLFKPQKFPESKEDVKNMKLFMDSLV